MGTLSGTLSGGQSYFFDKDSKSLYIINSGDKCDNKQEADGLVKAGKAEVYSKGKLEKIQEAFKHIVLLR